MKAKGFAQCYGAVGTVGEGWFEALIAAGRCCVSQQQGSRAVEFSIIECEFCRLQETDLDQARAFEIPENKTGRV
jgi:hypothetical protein